MEKKEVELKDLVGLRKLSGVSFDTIEPDKAEDGWHQDDAANSCTFILDGKAYQAIEDPSDGYRSTMRVLRKVSVKDVKNRFEPVTVLCRLQTERPFGGSCDLLEMLETVKGKAVLTVGTDNNDDYYPSFVAN